MSLFLSKQFPKFWKKPFQREISLEDGEQLYLMILSLIKRQINQLSLILTMQIMIIVVANYATNK